MRQYASNPTESQQFELDGVVFTVPGKVNLLDLVDLAEIADVDTLDPRAIKAVSALFRQLFGEGESYAAFQTHCHEYGTSTATLLAIMQDLVGDAVEGAGFPTQQASGSSTGSSTTASTYKVVSESSGSVVEFPLTAERKTELEQAVRTAQQQWEARRTG